MHRASSRMVVTMDGVQSSRYPSHIPWRCRRSPTPLGMEEAQRDQPSDQSVR
eukprot:CAMPEP_0204594682 /NCGR_PEP_ID=MMETSP0661-20131031/52224_1 /ASSEMBLY_ACC=CAM_ASM_000606 /TAXON_ID=109239 /ORGANISM="Alexandrium margalefi, Strain AMGDE01CS-322" /LENGTH=51 /DNA_ID=CAMNT_0051605107 /DNA_START=69 /DNA_END=221 /DNA_ORIENTATION=+